MQVKKPTKVSFPFLALLLQSESGADLKRD